MLPRFIGYATGRGRATFWIDAEKTRGNIRVKFDGIPLVKIYFVNYQVVAAM